MPVRTQPSREAGMYVGTLSFITRKSPAGETEVLLGRKYPQAKLGANKWSGPGGVQEAEESLERCLERETQEEFDIMLDMATARKIAIITFYAGGVPRFEMHTYHVTGFAGTPHPTREMLEIRWFARAVLPYGEMYEGDERLFRRLFKFTPFRAEMHYRTRESGLILPIEIMPFSP